MRLFIAIDFPKEIKTKIYKNTSALRKNIKRGVKWVEEENLHITFKFLGEVKEDGLIELSKPIENITQKFEIFKIFFDKVEIVPNLYNPRLIWYNMMEKSGNTNKIFIDIENELGKLGFKKSNRPLKLHSTLGRVKFPVRAEWKNLLSQIVPMKSFVLCQELTLFKSKLTPQGPIYSIVKKFKFKH